MKTFLIYGCGKSGVAALNLIWNKKDVFYLFDRDIKKQKEMYEKYKDKHNVFVLKRIENTLIDNLSLIVISPSVSIYNKKILYAKSKGIKVISELELGFLLTRNKFLAITGTNGKTTTTKLLYDIFKTAGKRAELVGNIGIPVCEKIKNKKRTTFICEVSSFQLEACFDFKPKIASILNLTCDHINRHKSIKRYKEEKFKIARRQDKNCFFVLNNNSEILKSEIDKFSCHIYFFDVYKKCFGTYLKNKEIFFYDGKKEEKVANINSTRLYGLHNYENILCAVCMAKLYKIKNKYIQKAIDEFLPFRHRMERIGKFDGVEYIDDSKATNIGASISAICSIQSPIILLLGGSDKGYDFKELFENLKENVVRILTFGEMGDKIFNTAKDMGFKNLENFKTLKEATKYAVLSSRSGEVVLLSPACASFDEFKSYSDRGEKFKEYVETFAKKKE